MIDNEKHETPAKTRKKPLRDGFRGRVTSYNDESVCAVIMYTHWQSDAIAISFVYI